MHPHENALILGILWMSNHRDNRPGRASTDLCILVAKFIIPIQYECFYAEFNYIFTQAHNRWRIFKEISENAR